MMKWVTVLLALLVFVVPARSAVDYWIGYPTTGDYLRAHLSNVMRSSIEFKKNIAQFEAQLERSRNRYFTSSGSDKEKAGNELGELLFGKDLFIAAPYLANGFGQHSNAMSSLFAGLNNNRQVDDGIRTPARPAFDLWIMSMRKALGAKGEDDTLFVSSASLEAAIRQTADSYDRYRQQRDLAETRAWAAAHPTKQDKSTAQRLNSSEVRRLLKADRTDGSAYGNALNRANRTAQLLECKYGPAFDGQGREVFGTVRFWKDKFPDNISVLVSKDERFVLTEASQVATACPNTFDEAARIMREKVVYPLNPGALAEYEADLRKEREKQVATDKQAQAQREAYAQMHERNRIESEQRSREIGAATAAKLRADSARREAELVEHNKALQSEYKARVQAEAQNKAQGLAPRPFVSARANQSPENAPAGNVAGAGGNNFVGNFRGTYQCAQGLTGISLSILPPAGAGHSGRWDFYATPGNPGVPTGALEVYAQESPDGSQLNVSPGRWINRPPGYGGVPFNLRPDGRGGLVGRMQGSGCGEIRLTRAG